MDNIPCEGKHVKFTSLGPHLKQLIRSRLLYRGPSASFGNICEEHTKRIGYDFDIHYHKSCKWIAHTGANKELREINLQQSKYIKSTYGVLLPHGTRTCANCRLNKMKEMKNMNKG